MTRGGTLVRAAATGVLANDSDPRSRLLTATLVTGSSHGVLTLAVDGGFTYVHNGSTAASDSFTYKANNGTIDTSLATVTIAITSPPPVAIGDTYTVTQGVDLVVPAPGALGNDTVNQAVLASYGVTGTEQTAAGGDTPTALGGSVNVAADGGFEYSPESGFTGSDAFKYVLTNSGGSSVAEVSLLVIPTPPTATDDSYITQRNAQLDEPAPGVLGNDTVINASIISYGAAAGTEQSTLGASTATTSGGTIRLRADGGFTYNPAVNFSGADSFKYRIATAGGDGTATVTITVQGAAADFIVTTPGAYFAFSGIPGQNPKLTLKRGRTYTFLINTDPSHPFQIDEVPAGSVINNRIFQGTVTFIVPLNPGNFDYECPIHEFGNDIATVP